MTPENIASGLRNMVDDIENLGAAPMTVDTALLRQAIAALTPPEGHVVVTRNEAGQAVAVTRQDDDGRILSVIAEFEGRWQPIESAQKDGTVWAFNGEQGVMAWSEGDGWALWVWADALLSDADPDPAQPTHWMPLPPPPEE